MLIIAGKCRVCIGRDDFGDNKEDEQQIESSCTVRGTERSLITNKQSDTCASNVETVEIRLETGRSTVYGRVGLAYHANVEWARNVLSCDYPLEEDGKGKSHCEPGHYEDSEQVVNF